MTNRVKTNSAKTKSAKTNRAMEGAGRQTLRNADDFIENGFIAPERATDVARVMQRYAAAMTEHLAQLVDLKDPLDPIALQFVPDPRELDQRDAELRDPIGDAAHSPMEGLVHRYPDRVLVKLLSLCPVYCRFCFRREMVGGAHSALLSDAAFEAILAYIAARPQIWEVILTGGDPLALSPRRLQARIAELAQIDHVKIIRIHTRAPIAAPALVTDELVEALKTKKATLYIAIHANHPREFSIEARAACERLADAGIPLVSQSVLLAGVNDDATILSLLMRTFVEMRIKPYYLHHLDLAPGTSHFRVPLAEGQKLVETMNRGLSGLARPHYMIDIPDGHGKISLMPTTAVQTGGQDWILTDARGKNHLYRDDF